MSGATEAVIYTASSSGSAAGGAAVFSTMAATGGVLIAGAAVYLAARKMRSDYSAAMTEYKTRSDREAVLHASQNASFMSAQQKARDMALSLTQCALDDPNTAFFLGGVGRLKTQLNGFGGPDGSGPTNGVALLSQRCDELLANIAAGEATAQFAAYEKLSHAVAELVAKLKTHKVLPGKADAVAVELVHAEVAALRSDIDDSVLSEKRHDPMRLELLRRLSEIEKLVAAQPSVALQSLTMLRERVRGELRGAAENAVRDARNAARMRDLVGQISAQAQSVLRQNILVNPKREAEALLKKVSALVTATPVELEALELLAVEAQTLFDSTEKALDEQAMAQYLEDQVAQVLGSLGYRVTSASNGDDSKKMVAVLDSGLGVQLNIDGQGHLSGEMVAFSEATSDVNAYGQEKVCNLMDDIFDGLRRRNLVVREKKRKNFKIGSERVKVVQPEATQSENLVFTVAPAALEMNVGP